MPLPWETEFVCQHSRRLCDSFAHWTGRSLLPRAAETGPNHEAGNRSPADLERAKQLFYSDRVVVSHGQEAEPLFNYGNGAALALWELSWAELIQMPSRQTAEPDAQAERAAMLAAAIAQGYCEQYVGIRVSSRGRRFRIEDGIIWTVLDEAGEAIGQAATFSRHSYLAPKLPPPR